jgi:hypothetical protein
MAKKKDKTAETTKTKSKKISKKKAAETAVVDGASVAAIPSPVPPELRSTGIINSRAAAAAPELSRDDIALRAYYIAERRRTLNVAGDELGDWVEAERQLRKEAPENSA